MQNLMRVVACLGGVTLFAVPALAGDVIAEPEPVEYVQACLAMGKGYFHIPGSDTCMKIYGNLRLQSAAGKNLFAYKGSNDGDSYRWETRSELSFETASDTELGLLRTVVLLRSQWNDGMDTEHGKIHQAYIELGGLRVGMDNSRFWTWTNYFGNVNNDDIVSRAVWQLTNFISYEFQPTNDLSALIAVEQGADDGLDYTGNQHVLKHDNRLTGMSGPNTRMVHLGSQIDNYTPNVLAGLKYKRDWGTISAIAAYQSLNSEYSGKVRVDFNITSRLSAWLMVGVKTSDDYYAYDAVYSKGKKHAYYYRTYTSMYGDWGGDWAVWGGHSLALNDKAVFNSQLTYDDEDRFSASANIAYTVVPNMVVTPELTYLNWGNGKTWDDGSRVTFHGKEAVQGTLRLQWNF